MTRPSSPFSQPRYQRDHQLYSLYELTPERLPDFQALEGVRFSKCKHLDRESVAHFASQLAQLISERFLSASASSPSTLAPTKTLTVVAPAHRHLKTAGVHLAEAVTERLKELTGLYIQLVYLSRHELNDLDFGTLKEASAREALIHQRFYYEGPELTGERVILIEDAVISGAHWMETQRALCERGVALERLVCVCIASVNPHAFVDGDYAVEDLLNHLWVKGHEPARLIQLIQDPPSQLSARSLKLLLGAPWSALTEALDATPWRKVLSLYHHVVSAAHLEGFDELVSYAAPLKRFERYAAQKLSEAKEGFGLSALYELREGPDAQLFDEPWWGGYTLSECYSLLKFGHPEVIERFAERLAELARERLGEGAVYAEWAVAAPGYQYAPGAARPLAERVAAHLGLPVVYVSRDDVPEVSYGALSSAEERLEVASGRFAVSGPGVGRSRCLVIDDAVVSGANLHVLCEALRREGAQEVRSCCLINVASPRLTLEERLNASVIHEKHLVPLITLLNTPSAPLVMRSVKLLLGLARAQLEALLSALPLWRWVDVLNVAHLNQMSVKPRFKEACALLSQHIRDAVSALKVHNTPPFIPLLTLMEHNTQAIMEAHGRTYSGLKYGDVEASKALLTPLLSLINAELGERLQPHGAGVGSNTPPQKTRFVVAGSNITFIPNAARYLAELIADRLNLPLADLRATGTFVGEFGALNTKAARAEAVQATPASVSDPRVVEGAHVIYLDDCVVSGAHLAEQVRALKEAGASEVSAFCLLDVSGREMSLEAELNYALVNPNEPTALVEILKHPKAPLLARSPKVFLRMPFSKAKRWLNELSTSRLFEMWEAVVVEGFSVAPELQEGFKALTELVGERHTVSQPTLEELCAAPLGPTDRRVDLLVLDYDETLAPTLSPLSEQASACLMAHLLRGTHLAIVSAQPIGERGLSEYFYEPFMSYLTAQRGRAEAVRLSAQLTLMPSEGLLVFKPNERGELELDQPCARFSLPPSQAERGEALLKASEAWGVASRRFERGLYTSLHFQDAHTRDLALKELNECFMGEGLALSARAKQAQDPNKYVLHVRPKHMSKALARDWLTRALPFKRVRCCVMGDKMGVSEGLNDDSSMIILGALNLALGDEVHPWASGALRGRRAQGGLEALQRLLS